MRLGAMALALGLLAAGTLLLPDGADARRGGGGGFRAGGFHGGGFRTAGFRGGGFRAAGFRGAGWHGARWAGVRPGWRRGWGWGAAGLGIAAGAYGSACYQPRIVWNGWTNVRRWVWVC
jgi:hypothetical protein